MDPQFSNKYDVWSYSRRDYNWRNGIRKKVERNYREKEINPIEEWKWDFTN